MSSMMPQSGPNAHADLNGACAGLDASARERADALARATAGRMEAALALLSMLDPEAFEIAFTAVAHAPDADGDDEPIPVCRQCGGLAGIFPDRGLRWQHFRGDGSTSGVQQIHQPGHAPEVTWILPDEEPDDLYPSPATRFRLPSRDSTALYPRNREGRIEEKR
jgi:hypothetical protein